MEDNFLYSPFNFIQSFSFYFVDLLFKKTPKKKATACEVSWLHKIDSDISIPLYMLL